MKTYWSRHPEAKAAFGVFPITGFKLEGENLLLVPHEIPGFSLESKSWSMTFSPRQRCMLKLNVVNLRIDHIKDIEWQADCFDYLVMGERLKYMMMNLARDKRLGRDMLPPKSPEFVMLFHGYVCASLCRSELTNDSTPRPPTAGKFTAAEWYVLVLLGLRYLDIYLHAVKFCGVCSSTAI
jgi:hypothetical protein